MNLVIFLTLVFSIYAAGNLVVFFHGWHAIPPGSVLRAWYLALFLFLSLSFIGGRILQSYWLSPVSDTLIWIGALWLAAALYFLLAIVALDAVRLVNHWLHFYPSFVTKDYARAKEMTLFVVVGVVGLVVVGGFINARMPRVRTLELVIDKHAGARKTLNIAMASDIHLGTIIGKSHLTRIVAMINGLKPDIVLLPGDIVDEDLAPVIKENLGETLRDIRAPLGVYAVTGNHEYIGGVESACRYLGDHGVRELRDEAVKIDDSFYLVGREDRSITRFDGRPRKPLEELVAGVDRTLPVILMDHQPVNLAEASANGVDIELSGHSHDGQMWPLKFIIARFVDKLWGYERIGGTQYYVSCGAGTWGPPVRVGNTPEVVNIIVTFRK